MTLLLFLLFIFPPPDVVIIEGVEYILDAEVYVDNMSFGRKTVCITTLYQVERKRVHKYPRITHIYVFQDNQHVVFEPYSFKDNEYSTEATGKFDTRFKVGSWVNVMVKVEGLQVGKQCVKVKEVY